MSNQDPTPESEKVLLVQQLFVREISSLRGSLWPILPDSHRLDDVVQETFLTVTRKAADFQEGTNFRAWLFTIGRYKALQSMRERKCEGLLSPDVLEAMTSELEMMNDFEERVDCLRLCIDSLPPHGKDMISLRYIHGKSLPEMAEVLSVKTNSIKVMLSRYRAILRNCIERKLIQQSHTS